MEKENKQGRSRRQRVVWAIQVLMAAFITALFTTGTALARDKWYPRDDLFALHFPTAEKGWACGRWGSIWHTSDGGKTWTQQKSGSSSTLSSIFFADDRKGWVVGSQGTILHTTDGGATWVAQQSPVDFFHMDVFFIDTQTGWIASEETHILHTKNGGETWEIQFSDEVYRLKAISFADADHGWAVGEYGFTYGTRDGGLTWEHQAGKWEVNDEGDIETGVFLFDVKAIDADTAVAVGSDGVMTRTDDGGATWTMLAHGFGKKRMHALEMTVDKTLIVVGAGLYLISHNGGADWTELSCTPDMAYSWFYGLAAIGDRAFAAVGEDGFIYRSDENGTDNQGLKQIIY